MATNRDPLLPPLPPDGSLRLADIRRWAREYDTLSDERTTALDFVGWLRIEAAAHADRRDSMGRRWTPKRGRRTAAEMAAARAASPPG